MAWCTSCFCWCWISFFWWMDRDLTTCCKMSDGMENMRRNSRRKSLSPRKLRSITTKKLKHAPYGTFPFHSHFPLLKSNYISYITMYFWYIPTVLPSYFSIIPLTCHWIYGKIWRKLHISRQKPWFPVDFPIHQSIEKTLNFCALCIAGQRGPPNALRVLRARMPVGRGKKG